MNGWRILLALLALTNYLWRLEQVWHYQLNHYYIGGWGVVSRYTVNDSRNCLKGFSKPHAIVTEKVYKPTHITVIITTISLLCNAAASVDV